MNDRLEEIKARADKATPGPWGYYRNYHLVHYSEQQYVPSPLAEDGESQNQRGDICTVAKHFNYKTRTYRSSHPDGEFIANSRADIDWLIEEVESLRSQLDGCGEMMRGEDN